MKNFEVYKDYISKHGTNTMAIKNGEATNCVGIQCSECLFKTVNECKKRKGQWLYEEYQKPKVKIPLATKFVLESLDDKWNWIVRDKDNNVICFENKPAKGKIIWVNNVMGGRLISNLTYILKNDMFNFLSWEDKEPTNIKELLENCEVINDE